MTIASRLLAAGTGWSVHDVVCDHGPGDRAFEERHATVCITAVTAGTFQYRTRQGTTTLAPGTLLLGNADACFECGHAHGHGDRCLAFHYAPDYFEEILADTPGIRGAEFIRAGLPPLQQLMPLLAELVAAREHDDAEAFEELAVRLAAAARTLQADAPP